jgi:hypothetical protein
LICDGATDGELQLITTAAMTPTTEFLRPPASIIG